VRNGLRCQRGSKLDARGIKRGRIIGRRGWDVEMVG
jgi:hypothetical protein